MMYEFIFGMEPWCSPSVHRALVIWNWLTTQTNHKPVLYFLVFSTWIIARRILIASFVGSVESIESLLTEKISLWHESKDSIKKKSSPTMRYMREFSCICWIVFEIASFDMRRFLSTGSFIKQKYMQTLRPKVVVTIFRPSW